jgi:hypothetical protein
VSVLQSPGVPNSLVAGKNAGNFADSAAFLRKFVSKTPANTIVCERIPSAIEQGIFSRVQGTIPRFGPEQGIWAKSIRALALYGDLSSQRTRGRTPRPCWPAILAPPETLPRSRRSLTVFPRLDTGGRPRMRPQEAGRGLAFILAARAGGRPGRSWSRAPATDHPHPRGDPRRLRLGRRRGSPCLLRAPGRFRRRPCGRSSP